MNQRPYLHSGSQNNSNSNAYQPYPQQNTNPQPGQYMPGNKPKANYTDFIRLKINNPFGSNLKGEPLAVQYDIIKYFNSIKIPDISSISSALEASESIKKEYSNLINLTLDNQVGSKNEQKPLGINNENNANSSMGKKNYDEQIDRFMKHFNCPRPTAEYYIEAFRGDFDSASQEYDRNSRA